MAELSFDIPELRRPGTHLSSEGAFDRLTCWLRSCGTDIGPLALRLVDDTNRELQAESEIPSEARLLRIPLRCLITTAMARNSELGKHIADAGMVAESDHLLISVQLLHEHHDPRSFFRPYLDMLPPAFPGVPLLFREDERKLLRGSFVLADTEQRQAALRVDYQNLCHRVWHDQRFTFAQFLWAFLATSTRLFPISINSEILEAMVPLADMMNHSATAESKRSWDQSEQFFILTAARSIPPGEPIHYNYGPKSTGRFLFNYGFCPETDAHDEAEIVLPELPADHPMKTAVKIGRPRADSGVLRFRIPLSYASSDTRQVFSMLRLLSWMPEDGPVFPIPGEGWAEIPPVNRRNESAALHRLVDACRSALNRFPESLAEDLRLLEGPELPTNTRNCILTRAREKRVLQGCLELAASFGPLLQARDPLPSAPDRFSDYVQQLAQLP